MCVKEGGGGGGANKAAQPRGRGGAGLLWTGYWLGAPRACENDKLGCVVRWVRRWVAEVWGRMEFTGRGAKICRGRVTFNRRRSQQIRGRIMFN